MQALTEAMGANPAFTLIAVVLGLLVVLVISGWLFKKIAGGGAVKAQRGRAPRLSVTDAAIVDDKRRLVLVRRDNVEHLLMIGGPNDLVIEHAISRVQPVAAANREIRAMEPQAEAPAATPPAAPVYRPRQALEEPMAPQEPAGAIAPERRARRLEEHAPPPPARQQMAEEAGHSPAAAEQQPPARLAPAIAERPVQVVERASAAEAPQPPEPRRQAAPPAPPAAPDIRTAPPAVAAAPVVAAAATLALAESEPEVAMPDFEADMLDELVKEATSASEETIETGPSLDFDLESELERDLASIGAESEPEIRPEARQPELPDLESALSAELGADEIDFSELLEAAPAKEEAPSVASAEPRKEKRNEIEDEMQRLLDELTNA